MTFGLRKQPDRRFCVYNNKMRSQKHNNIKPSLSKAELNLSFCCLSLHGACAASTTFKFESNMAATMTPYFNQRVRISQYPDNPASLLEWYCRIRKIRWIRTPWAGPLSVFGPNHGLINGFSGVAHCYVFLPFSVVSGPNLTFFKKIRWLDINLSYFHTKF